MNKNELPLDKIDSVIELFTSGKTQLTLDAIDALSEIYPNEPVLFNIKGACYATLGQLNKAILIYKKAISIMPDYADLHYNLGNTLRELNQLEDAIKSYENALSIKKDYVAARYNLGVTLQELERYDDAAEQYEKALLNDSQNIEVLINLGSVYQALGQFEEASEQYEAILAINPLNEDALNNLGIIFRDLDQSDDAISYFKKVLEINPQYAGAYYNLGFIYQDLGKAEDAISQYEKAVAISDHAWSYHNLSYLKNYKANDPHITKIKLLLSSNNLIQLDRIHLNLALAKVNESLGNQKEFFKFLNEGNSLRKKELDYSLDQTLKTHTCIKKIFKSTIPSIKKLNSFLQNEKRPIFIVGMPRSGTSLVEQIISSHHQVFGAGELNTLTKLVSPIIKNYLAGDITKLTEKTLLYIHQEYSEMLSRLNSSEAVITDKLPLNFQYIGFILSIFPDAKIVHLKRDARATCWSNYKHFFTDEENGYSHNFDDLIGFYSLYKDLMDFWHETYPNKIYDLCYEDLTKNQEKETKKLLEYCDLDWDENCLKFHENQRQVKTPSTMQVRKKMYQGSSDDWKKHWTYIQPLIDGLKSL